IEADFDVSGVWLETTAASCDFIVVRKARFLARERAGSSIAARAATMRITTVSSMSVKARSERCMILRGVFMLHSISMAVAIQTLAGNGLSGERTRWKKSEADAQCVSFTPDPQLAGRMPAP